MSLKNPVTPPGIDPGTVRLVAQRLNHNTTPGSLLLGGERKFICSEGSREIPALPSVKGKMDAFTFSRDDTSL